MFFVSKIRMPRVCCTCCWAADAGSGGLATTLCSGCSITFLAQISGESCGDEACDHHKDKSDHDERERSPPGASLRADIGRRRVHEDLRGQRGVGAAEYVLVR